MAVAAKKRVPPPSPSRNVVAEARRPRRPAAGRWLWDNLKSLAGALAIFLFIRAVLVEAFRIPSESMVPTLLVGDWLFVNKLVYGPRIRWQIPLTDARLPLPALDVPGYAEPRRGEVVVFESPVQPPPIRISPLDSTPTLVKRLVGVPGDTLAMRDGVLLVNGDSVFTRDGVRFVSGIPRRPGDEPAADVPPGGGGDQTDPTFEWQRAYLAPSVRDRAAYRPTHDNWGPLVLPPGRYFMLGDNRYNSVDSRYYGLVPRENIRGRPIFVYYSYDPSEVAVVPFVTNIRWGRIGHRIR
jgi:signal peptidase I